MKIFTGDLRIGLREGLVEEAIARAFDAPLDDVKEAHMLLGDIGQTALLASRRELDRAELTLFRPIKCMLASPEPTAEAIWARFAKESPEESMDLRRRQVRRHPRATASRQERVEIFSRDLRRITEQFAEIAGRARGLTDEVILDGEIMAFEHGKEADVFRSAKTTRPQERRRRSFRRALRGCAGGFRRLRSALAERAFASEDAFARAARTSSQPNDAAAIPGRRGFTGQSAEEIESAFQMARRRLNEGLMIKDPESHYTPGRRGLSWFKLKKELATLDVVVVAAELGHGKRNHVLSDYTFAVRDEATGELLPIGKAYSGLTDVEIAELTEHFRRNTIRDRGRYLEVKPDTVLEIAFDSIQPSTRHASGLALRFPRIKAIRRDKTPDAIDTLAYARKLAEETR